VGPAPYQIIDLSKVGSDLDSSAFNANRRHAQSKSQMRFPVVFLRRFAQNADGRAANAAQSLRVMNRNNWWSNILLL